MKLRVLTINVAGIQFGWFEGRRDVLVKEVIKLSPDIIFLQESMVVHERNYDQALDIAQVTELLSCAFAPYGNNEEFNSPRLGGISILSRWPMTLSQIRKLPPGVIDPYGARTALMCRTNLKGKDLLLATTHLSYRPEESELRLKQTRELLKFLEGYQKERVIFGGDFNDVPTSLCVSEVTQRFQDSGNRENTWSSENNFVHSRSDRLIDYLFSSRDVKVQGAAVVLKEKCPVFPSDHFGVFGEYEI